MGVYQNSKGLADDMIREGLRRAGPRSPQRQWGSNEDIGRKLMEASEARIAAQRPRLEDPSEESNLTAEEYINRGLAQAYARENPTRGKPGAMSTPPSKWPRR
jgi:hypothetical protein